MIDEFAKERNMLKKIISILICLSLIMSSAISSFASYTTTEAINVLKAMDVLEGDPDGNMRENDFVKRSEFAKLAVLLSAYKTEVSLNSNISVFTDCTSGHWASPYARVAAAHGIIEGYPDGRFGPDDYITYAQSVTIALRLLGYNDEDFGFSYPDGQLNMAESLKLGSGLAKTSGDMLTRGDVAVLLANMLTSHKKDTSQNYIDSLGYSIIDDTIIIAGSDEDASVAPGKVFTSNGEYIVSNDFDKNLIGKKGRAVINSEGVFITLLEGTVSAKKASVYSASGEHVSVYMGGTIRSLDCDGGTLCYKGTEKTNFTSLVTRLATGDILTVGMDTDGNVDYIIEGKSDFEGPFTVKNEGAIPIDGSYGEYSVIINGKSSSAAMLRKNDILYISHSLSSIFVYTKKISGIYSKAIPNADSPKSVVVGGSEYLIESPSAFSKLYSGGEFDIGDSVILLIGRDGGIADVASETGISAPSYVPPIKSETDTLSKEVALLSQLGAIDVGKSASLNGDDIITRGEFAKIAVMVSVYRNRVQPGAKVSIFPDCTVSYWATPYIKTAVENNLMSAYGDSMFYPENALTLAQAADTALKILGYTDSDFSDWPSSRISLSASKGITHNIVKAAYDELTKSEAIRIIYNTLCATVKSGKSKGIEQLGYEYYDDSVIIATNKNDSSVPFGKVLTSNGSFSIDEMTFDYSSVGKAGELLVYSGKVQMFNKKPLSYASFTVYSSVPGGLAIMDGDNVYTVSVPDGTPTYINASKTTFASATDSVAIGDTAYIYYDSLGRQSHVYVNTDSLDGPFTVVSPTAWYSQINGAGKDSKIMKNGMEISADELSKNDIVYYSVSVDTAFAYNSRVIGILEGASPSIASPASVRVSGVNYSLEVVDALDKSVNLGDTVVLCLGRDGKVAHSYSASGESMAGYLVSAGVKEFINQNGESYTSPYAGLILADGIRIDCATDSDYERYINSVMTVTFSGAKAKLSKLTSSGNVYGAVDCINLTVGSSKVASDVKILDVGYLTANEATVYKSVYMQRLDGISLSASDVVYSKIRNGYVTELILNNVTGDAFSYGVVTSAKTTLNDKTASGSYTCDIDGTSYSYNGGAYSNIRTGSVVKVGLSGGRLQSLIKLESRTVSIKTAAYTSITLTNGELLPLADDVSVYRLMGTYDYTHIPLSEIVQNTKSYNNYYVYLDKAASKGGRVRVIVVK